MKKLFLILSFLLLPAISFANTITTTSGNVPVQISESSTQVIMLLPASSKLELISKSGDGYNIKYNNISGWVYSGYVSENSTGEVENLTNDEKMSRIIAAANKYGKQFGIDPNLILAITYVESGFNPNAVSSANCLGLMQVSAYYAPSLGIDADRLFEIEYNMYHGTRIFAQKMVDMGNTYDALRAYNAGTGGAKSNKSQSSGYANKVLNKYNEYKTMGFSY